MDELHTLALEVARRILESGDEPPENIELARSLLGEEAKVKRSAASDSMCPPPPSEPAGQQPSCGPAGTPA